MGKNGLQTKNLENNWLNISTFAKREVASLSYAHNCDDYSCLNLQSELKKTYRAIFCASLVPLVGSGINASCNVLQWWKERRTDV